ncbi:MAG: hypothetical protein QXE31_02720 [Candidatus Woesearchaeota archaeon]
MWNYIGIVDNKIYQDILSYIKGLSNKRCLLIRNRLEKAIEAANKKSEDFEETNKKFRKQGYKAAEEAFLYLNQKQYSTWTVEDIIKVNYIITQGQFGEGFRDKRVFIQGSNVSVPSPEKVPYHMQYIEMILQEKYQSFRKIYFSSFCRSQNSSFYGW